MNTKLILLSVFTVFYFLATQWWYSNNIAGVCCGDDQTEEAMAANSVKDAAVLAVAPALPLAFQWMNADPTLGTDFDTFKNNSILKGMKEDNVLQITGNYFKDETAIEGFDNMGLARAAAVREILKDHISMDRVDISSRLVTDNATMKDTPFEGVTFNWREALKKEETTIVEVENESTIYFPFNSSVKDQNKEVDTYLLKLAERLNQTTEKVSIIGHTDNVGEDEANQTLGLNRAVGIRAILIANGVTADRITIDSKGEAQPATTNETEDGRYRNRRTVLSIVAGG
ncbi:MAG: outer membrane protein OmpA-like peptidoglycan-associated protein [Nonlabens sp.]|jgi:outer membrane protein OmpA-like peptidoglycan-associated protein